MKITLTIHAIERYQKRINPALTFKQARRELSEALPQATRLKESSVRGHILWSVASPSMRLVTKIDAGQYVCVTILPPDTDSLGDDLALLEGISENREQDAQAIQREVKEIEAFLASEKKQLLAELSQRRAILALEAQILSYEVAAIRSREKTLRHQLQTQIESDKLRDALRIAIQGLVGALTPEQALAQVSSLSGSFAKPKFYLSEAPQNEQEPFLL